MINARGGYSNHSVGIAFDVGVFEGSRFLGESLKYKAVGALGMDLGLEWADGLAEKELLTELRDRTENGTPVYA